MRPSWDEYFFEILQAVRKRATCDRGKTGCILTHDNQILATGYVGSISGQPHCDEKGHWIVDQSCIRTVHAEVNAISQCAKLGISTQNATAYLFLFPCLSCTKLLIQCGINEIKAVYDYQKSDLSKKFLDKASIPWSILNNSVYKYR